MSTYTPNLDLLKKNPVTEGSDVFNIETMMNDNWDKIDTYAATVAASVAPAYNSSSAYAVGAHCNHGGQLYRCNTAIGSGGEAWNASHWTAISADQLVQDMAGTTTPAMDGTGAAGSATKWARSDHVHPSDTSRAPKSHAASGTTYGAGSGSNYGHVKLSDSTSSTSGTSGGIAATPAAVKAVGDVKADKTALNTYVRPNLLDNWDFRTPVNTRGQSNYTATNTFFGVDRWQAYKVKETISDGYLRLTNTNAVSGNISQMVNGFAVLAGKKMTYSILYRVNSVTGNLRLTTITNSSHANTMIQEIDATVSSSFKLASATFTAGSNFGGVGFYNYVSASSSNTSVDIVAFKLEVGGTQTLAHEENGQWVLNEAANPTEQLLRSSVGEELDPGYDSGTGLGLYRREAFFSSDTTPSINGAINWTYG